MQPSFPKISGKIFALPLFALLLGSCPILDLIMGESIDEGPIFEDPPPVITSDGIISGFVWNDECEVPAEFTGEIPEGCVENNFDVPNFGFLVGNGVLDAGETGLAGVLVTLGLGPCPSTGYSETHTDFVGGYRFDNLSPSTYCVSVDPLSPENESDMIPGNFTVPDLGVGEETVTIESGIFVNVDFGWDFQEVG
jgi:hypothetical protein